MGGPLLERDVNWKAGVERRNVSMQGATTSWGGGGGPGGGGWEGRLQTHCK